MDVSVLSIARNGAKAHDGHDVVYDVSTEIDAIPHTFAVLVGARKIGADAVPYATFRDPDELRIFAHDHRPITEIIRRVIAAHNGHDHEPIAAHNGHDHESVVLPASARAHH